ncbi:MAG: hypothetical protein IJ634_03180 [Bacteroidales bacterium]|nr:hypothetical protein [Bacteroidales bacterium]
MAHKNRYGKILVLALLCLTTTLSACHKTCTCIGYNGVADTYTAEEVDDRGVTCPDMVFFGGVQYYSVCSWD